MKSVGRSRAQGIFLKKTSLAAGMKREVLSSFFLSPR
jgi:hypothetical protein